MNISPFLKGLIVLEKLREEIQDLKDHGLKMVSLLIIGIIRLCWTLPINGHRLENE